MKKSNFHRYQFIKRGFSNIKWICSAIIILLSFEGFSQKSDSYFSRNITIPNSNIQIDTLHKQHSIYIKNWSNTTEISTPELPVKYELVYIPNGYKASITYKISKSKKISRINLRKSLPQNIDTEDLPPYNPDSIPSYPVTDKWFFNSPVSIDRIIEFKGHKIALVKLSPVQYNPLQKTLLIHSKFNYTIYFTPDNHKIASAVQPKTTIKDIKNLKRWVVNPEGIEVTNHSKQQNTFSNYLIITCSNYAVAADTLALWKQECGYKTKIIQKAIWTSQEIKDTIRSLYLSSDFSPDYVCFIGDHDLVPGTEKIAPPPLPQLFATDLYYVCMGDSSDFFPDIAYGRISVSNQTEATATVKKIIHYEKFPPTNQAFYQNAAHCSFFQDDNYDGFDDRRFVQTSEEIREYIQQNTDIQVQRIYEANSDVTPQNWNNGLYSLGEAIPAELLKPGFAWDGSTSDMINAMNYGRLYIFHRDHGFSNATGWAHPSFLTSQIQYIFNLTQLPLIISINCHTGEFSKPECFAEKMLRSSSGGCFGIFAPSFYSYSGYNDAFSMGIFDGFWGNPGITPNFTGSGGTPIPDFDNALSVNKPGDVLIHSLIFSTLYWGFNQHTNEIMHYFGDPTTTFYTTPPDSITAQLSDTIYCNSESYFVQTENCQNCIASIRINNQLIAGSQIINDTLTLHFNAMYGDTAYVTITGIGKRPYFKSVIWHCNQPVFAPIANFSVSDSIACNGTVQFTDESQHFPQEWFWDFGDGITSNLQNPTHIYNEPGYYNVKLKAANIHGSDSIFKSNIIRSITPIVPLFSDTILCQPSQLTLSVMANQTVYWYDDIAHQNLIDTGSSIYFNNISENTDIYPFTINTISNLPLGISDNSGQGGYIYNNKKNYLVFKALDDIVIASVKIFSNANGNKIIELCDSVGNMITNKIYNFSIGENTVPLNFSIQKGKRYRLVGPTYSNFHATNVGVHYPYVLHNALSIDSSSSTNPLDTYYYFYDFRINRSCFSHADTLSIVVQNVDVTISPSGKYILCPDIEGVTISTNSGIDATWSNGSFGNHIYVSQTGSFSSYFSINNCNYFSDTIEILSYSPINTSFFVNCQNNNCQFINTSTNAIWYFWDFGDGTYSNEMSQTHVFADTGTYYVQLMAYTNCDTSYFNQYIRIDALLVSESDLTSIGIYPNPLIDGFYITNKSGQTLSINVYNAEGQIISQLTSTKNEVFIDVKSFAGGIYFVELRTNDLIIWRKLLKINKF